MHVLTKQIKDELAELGIKTSVHRITGEGSYCGIRGRWRSTPWERFNITVALDQVPAIVKAYARLEERGYKVQFSGLMYLDKTHLSTPDAFADIWGVAITRGR